MLLPLVALAGLALLGGALNLPFADRLHVLGHWLEPVIVGEHQLPGAATKWVLGLVAIVGALTGLFLAYRVYQERRVDRAKVELPVFAHAWYIDETYARVAGGPGEAAFQGVADFDATVVDGAVEGVARGTRGLGTLLRPLQSGLIRSYALGVAFGAVLLLTFVVVRMNV
jgi:NADH-quinone oxidoreductase subunit L